MQIEKTSSVKFLSFFFFKNSNILRCLLFHHTFSKNVKIFVKVLAFSLETFKKESKNCKLEQVLQTSASFITKKGQVNLLEISKKGLHILKKI